MVSASQPNSLLVVWHSRTGASKAMAAEAAQAAQNEVHVDLRAAHDITPEHLLMASGYLFVCPENLGTMSGAMKEFFDRCYYPALGRIEGRPYGSIIAAGSDGTGAQAQMDRIVTGWRLRRVVEPEIVNFQAESSEAILADKLVPELALEKCREIGQLLGAGLAMGAF